jgi:hypothetical protein
MKPFLLSIVCFFFFMACAPVEAQEATRGTNVFKLGKSAGKGENTPTGMGKSTTNDRKEKKKKKSTMAPSMDPSMFPSMDPSMDPSMFPSMDPTTTPPDSCVGFCGERARICYCDPECVYFDDCCFDYGAVCTR